MPFTISHAAAVLPAVRRDGSGRGRLVPSLLVAGSFAPDLTYFAASAVPGAMEFGDITHSFPGVLTVDVAIAAALAGLWRLLREPAIALLPGRVRGRVLAVARGGVPAVRRGGRQGPAARGGVPTARSGGRQGPVARVWWWYVSVVLGATTHVVWDAFTHLDRWGMRVFPVLGEKVAGSPLYWYAQYGGSAVALVVIALFVVSAVRRVPEAAADEAHAALPELSASERWMAAVVIGGCVAVAAGVRTARWWAYWGAVAKPWEIIPTLCFGAGAGLALGLTLYALLVRGRRGPAGDGEARPPAEPSRPASR
ncbi:DUF4184 family protein [Streptomyces antnestii]|uniref:DUF4184 family protein n=1 Tax=Streptomyces antnestii TaxID=2494256 RepID=A0A437PIL7_9ACTN|nr:DUF4184 family protein [Streptomyces sp. San01]RVU22150.1 DUF4184 family protein [Streptomyces sp. San01]